MSSYLGKFGDTPINMNTAGITEHTSYSSTWTPLALQQVFQTSITAYKVDSDPSGDTMFLTQYFF